MYIPFGIFSASSGGAASDYELISTTVLGSAQASVVFSSLNTVAAAYKHLQLRMLVRSDRAGETNTNFGLRFNGDSTAANYTYHQLEARGSGGVNSFAGAGGTYSYAYLDQFTAGTNTTANVFTPMIVDILDFSNTSKNTTVRSLLGHAATIYTGNAGHIVLNSNAWLSTAAITSISTFDQFGNSVAGSRFSLYGLR